MAAIAAATDISSLYNISSDAIKNSLLGATDTQEDGENLFSSIFDAAVSNVNETNGYLSDQENEKLKLAMGLTDDTSELSIAIQKAETALSYTVALRDRLLQAYNELMQIQM